MSRPYELVRQSESLYLLTIDGRVRARLFRDRHEDSPLVEEWRGSRVNDQDVPYGAMSVGATLTQLADGMYERITGDRITV